MDKDGCRLIHYTLQAKEKINLPWHNLMEKKLFKKKFKNDSHHKEKIKIFQDSKNITLVLCNI